MEIIASMLLIGLPIAFIVYSYARSRVGNDGDFDKSGLSNEISVDLDPDECFELLTDFVNKKDFAIDFIDSENCKIILSTQTKINNYGLIIPIQIFSDVDIKVRSYIKILVRNKYPNLTGDDKRELNNLSNQIFVLFKKYNSTFI